MVVVRLARGGAKKHPFYHIVVTDSRRPRDSGYIERLGYFNPFATEKELPVVLNRDRFDYWISKGAKSSQRVSSIISKSDKGKLIIKTKAQPKPKTKKTATDSTPASDSTEITDKEGSEVVATTETPKQVEAETNTSQSELKLEDQTQDKQELQQTASAAEQAKPEDKAAAIEQTETTEKPDNK